MRLAESGSGNQIEVDGRGDVFAAWQECRSGCRDQVVVTDFLPEGAGSWQPPVQISTGAESYLAKLGVDASGDGIAVFNTPDGPWSAVRPASLGTWQGPVSVGNLGGEASDLHLAVDAAGDAAAVWLSQDFTVEASYRPAASGEWEAPLSISAPGEHAKEPGLAIRDGGELAVIWSVYEPETAPCSPPHDVPCQLILHDVESLKVALRPGGGTWQAPATLARTDYVGEPQIALDDAGNVTALWKASSGSNRTVESSLRPADGAWLPPTTLMSASLPYIANPATYDLQLAVDAGGDATAAWIDAYVGANGGLSGVTAVETVVRGAGGAWGTPSVLEGSEPHAGDFHLAENSSGAAVAVWTCSIPPHYPLTVRAATRPAALARWGAAADISGSEGGFPGIAIGPDGNAFAIWTELGPFTSPAPSPGIYVTAYEASRGTPGVPQSNGCPATAPQPTAASRPTLARVRMAHRRFHVIRGSTAIEAKTSRGTAFLFDLSPSAGVRVAISRLTSGVRSGRRCRAAGRTSHRLQSKRCRHAVPVAVLVRRSEPAGHDRIRFTGRVGRRVLRPGDYEARLTAANGAGSSPPAIVRFEVAPR